MDDKLEMQSALLDHLEKESEKIQSLMDELLKSMDTIPSEQRHGPAWEANTNRFLKLVERSGDIARKLQLGSDAIKKGAYRKETVLRQSARPKSFRLARLRMDRRAQWSR